MRIPEKILIVFVSVLSLIVLPVILTYWTSLIDWPFVKSKLGNDSVFWLIIFTIASFIIVIWYTSKKEIDTDSSASKNRQSIAANLLIRYQNRKKQKLGERLPLSLKLQYDQRGTRSDYVSAHFLDGAKTTKDIDTSILEIFKTFKYVLLVGDPGSGKTTLLINLAISILTDAQLKDCTIPIVVNLSSWNFYYEHFEDFLLDSFEKGNGFSRSFADELMSSKELILLLDGLDEIGYALEKVEDRIALRSKCLKSIESFLERSTIEYLVICSRIIEYEELNNYAPVKAQLLVKPLNTEQILSCLTSSKSDINSIGERQYINSIAAENLLFLIAEYPLIVDAIRTPLYFNLSTYLFSDATIITDVKKINELQILKEFIVTSFILQKLRKAKHNKFSSWQLNLKYLKNISQIERDILSTKTFDLFSFYPGMLKKSHTFFGITFLVGFLYGALMGSAIGLNLKHFLTVTPAQVTIGSQRMFGAMTLGLLYGVYLLLIQNDYLYFVDIKGWRVNPLFVFKNLAILIRDVFAFMFIYLVYSSILFLVMFPFFLILENLIFAFLSAIKTQGNFSAFLSNGGWMIYSPLISYRFALLTAFLSGIPLSICHSLYKGILSKLQISTQYIEVQNPYDKLLKVNGVKFTMFITFFSLPILILIFLNVGYIDLRHILVALLSNIGLYFISSSISYHMILRFCFFKEGILPFYLVEFLDFSTDTLGILERDGSRWRFKHQIIQDYL